MGGVEQGRQAKSAVRAIEVLERLAEPLPPPTLTALATELGAPKSSLHAVVGALVARGWVERGPDGRYSIGVRALRLGTAYLDMDPVVALTLPVMDELAAQLDETIHLGRLDGSDIVYVAKRESTQALRMFSAVGRRLPAYATALGKALLAGLEQDQLEDHLPAQLTALTEATITDRDALREELAAIRARGWSTDLGENAEGIGCIAVALPLASPPQDALSCSVPTVRFDAERQGEIRRALERARDRVAGGTAVT